MTCLRHLGPDKTLKDAKTASANSHPYVVGFGMGGDETRHSCRQFAAAFDLIYDPVWRAPFTRAKWPDPRAFLMPWMLFQFRGLGRPSGPPMIRHWSSGWSPMVLAWKPARAAILPSVYTTIRETIR